MLVNLTGADVSFLSKHENGDADIKKLERNYDRAFPRVVTNDEATPRDIDGIPIMERIIQVIGLPDPSSGVRYLVKENIVYAVALGIPWEKRADLYFPSQGTHLINGGIVRV